MSQIRGMPFLAQFQCTINFWVKTGHRSIFKK
jgi:hypothetical protein